MGQLPKSAEVGGRVLRLVATGESPSHSDGSPHAPPERGAALSAAERIRKAAPRLRTVIVESNQAFRAQAVAILDELRGVAVAAQAETPEEGFAAVLSEMPDLVLVGLDTPASTLAFAERTLEARRQTTILVCAETIAPALLKQGLRAGIREVLTRPLDRSEVGEAMGRLLADKADTTDVERTAGQIIAVFAAKGGLGATFLATNLAVLLSRQERRTAIVDLNLELGDVDTYLNVKAERSIVDLADQSRMGNLDLEALESPLIRHRSGLHMLAQPADAAAVDRLAPGEIARVLTQLRSAYGHIVLDLARRFDARTAEALDLADHILLVTTLDLPAIRNTRRAIETFTRLGHASRLRLVLNRHRAARVNEQLEQAFGIPVFWHVPDDHATAFAAINAGVPVEDVGPKTELADSLRTLAVVFSEVGPSRAAAVEKAQQGLLKRLLQPS